MANFVVNAQPQDACEPDFVMHNVSAGCDVMRQHVAWIKLGDFPSNTEALIAASRSFPNVVVCDCCGTPEIA